MGSPVPQSESFGKQNEEKERSRREVRDALRIDGSQFVRLYEKMQALIAGITDTVTAVVNSITYTTAGVDAAISASASTKVSKAGDTMSGDLQVNGQLRDPDAATFNITGTRLTVWVETATGRFGNTASSRKYKQGEQSTDVDPEAILSVDPRKFQYIAEVRKRDDPKFEDYVGPDYEVADEYGLMAEDLHDAGLAPWVIYKDEGGVPQPESVDYVMWVVALQIAARKLAADRDAMRKELDEFRTRLGRAGL